MVLNIKPILNWTNLIDDLERITNSHWILMFSHFLNDNRVAIISFIVNKPLIVRGQRYNGSQILKELTRLCAWSSAIPPHRKINVVLSYSKKTKLKQPSCIKFTYIYRGPSQSTFFYRFENRISGFFEFFSSRICPQIFRSIRSNSREIFLWDLTLLAFNRHDRKL